MITDRDLIIRSAIIKLNAKAPAEAKASFRGKNNPDDLYEWGKTHCYPFPDPSDEVIPRDEWDLEGLYGETEYQLLHPHYMRMANYIFENYKKKHDTLVICQCSNIKPYTEIPEYKHILFGMFKNFADYCCVSNPGMVPLEYSNLYPYRYDEWDPRLEPGKPPILINRKYFYITLCRILAFKRKFGYKNVIFQFSNYLNRYNVENFKKHNIDGGLEWAHYGICDESCNEICERYPQLGGLFVMRARSMYASKKYFVKALASVTPDSPEFQEALDEFDRWSEISTKKHGRPARMPVNNRKTAAEVWKNIKERIDSTYDPYFNNYSYEVIEHIDPQECISKIKEEPFNKLLYKTDYWTCLDVLLYGLDGRLTMHIDEDYWKLMEAMEHDDRFIKINKFIFAKKDSDIEKIKVEALKIRLDWKPKPLELNPKILKPLKESEKRFLNNTRSTKYLDELETYDRFA